MKATLVSLRASEASVAAGAPQLTPELLAASGARYSRNNEGLASILSKIDPQNQDKSVDSIFRMIDYGHQSIADMVPVSIFIDDVSIWLAYLIWSQCPTAGGQESSTRYVRLASDGLAAPSTFSVSEADQRTWYSVLEQSFHLYAQALEFWEGVATERPEVMRIPEYLLSDLSEKAQKQVSRMKRNFAFDRSRYLLPVCALTNMMLVMSARGWVQLCQYLLSHYHPEAVQLGELLVDQLRLEAPRMIKHAVTQTGTAAGLLEELEHFSVLAAAKLSDSSDKPITERASVEVLLPSGATDAGLASALSNHSHRYAFIGEPVRSSLIRFGWKAVSIAEIRDLNRHRTGTKWCPLVPRGFYCAQDEAERLGVLLPQEIEDFGKVQLNESLQRLARKEPSYAGWILLGHQFEFTHSTTLDKFVYEAELRTGTGAHYKYAQHLRDAVSELHSLLPIIAQSISLGTAEPE